jgi:protein-S-isoprenylcysteine O-methyltransferase Ste14
VVVKEGHALVTSGPYRYVRHPIYTGILLAFLGTALAIGEWRALLAVPFAVLSFIIKSRMEEGRMRETFPQYEAYQRGTAALIPFVY